MIPLHYMADAESLATLRLAARRPEEALRGVAVAAMLHRGDSMAMDVILDIALRNKALPRVPKESVFLLRDEHKPKLRQLRNLPVRKDPASMPAAQEEAENHRQPVWIESYQCNSDPIWVLEALGHLGDANALREYNAYAFTVRTQIGSPRGASGDRVSKLYHTPLTARASDLESMLNLVYSSYCTEAMAKELMDGLKVLPQWFSLADVRVLEAFAANPKLHDRYRKLAADLAGRPIPLKTKQVLMHNAVRIRVLEVNDALKRWATSDYSGLARDARKTLQELVAK